MHVEIGDPYNKNCGLETEKYAVWSLFRPFWPATLNMQMRQILIISLDTQPEIHIKNRLLE